MTESPDLTTDPGLAPVDPELPSVVGAGGSASGEAASGGVVLDFEEIGSFLEAVAPDALAALLL